jgi:hypothetical protein
VWPFVLLFALRGAAVARPRLRRVAVAERLDRRPLGKVAVVALELLVAQRALRLLRTRDRTRY